MDVYWNIWSLLLLKLQCNDQFYVSYVWVNAKKSKMKKIWKINFTFFSHLLIFHSQFTTLVKDSGHAWSHFEGY